MRSLSDDCLPLTKLARLIGRFLRSRKVPIDLNKIYDKSGPKSSENLLG